MKPTGSEIITAPKEQHSKIGMPDGEHGLATPESLRVAAWLSKQTPEAVEGIAVSRALSHGVSLRVSKDFRSIRDTAGNVIAHESPVRSVEVSGSADSMALVLADMEKMKTPAPVRAIEAWLAELLFPNDLDAFSARFRPPWRFWPSWEELEKVCEAMVAPRNAMIMAIQRYEAPKEEPRELPSLERRREMVAEAQRVIGELAGKGESHA